MIFDTIYNFFFYIELGASFLVFISLFLIVAPYGRHFRKGWGITIHERFAWIIMEFPAFFLPLILFLLSKRISDIVAVSFLLIWELHYVQRTFIYSALIPHEKRNFSLIVALMGFIFNIINGYVQGFFLFFKSDEYSLSWLTDVRFIAGFVIFICGFVINLSSDKALRDLKKNGDGAYKIPHGGMFTFISSPNYFGEIIEWIGWSVLTWSTAGIVFVLFTMANLIPRAISHHKWYKKSFPDYPKERKAILPFLL
jgi:3-oxo-5-alpha-steroid 4-dehydrogenase 1